MDNRPTQEEIYSNLNKDITWLRDKTIFLTVHGSHAYGLATEASDIDIRGIAVPPIEYHFGFNKSFDQLVSKQPYDMQVFDLIKFFGLSKDGNPNSVELLFTDEADHIFVSPIGKILLDHRDEFLSRNLKERYIGYAHSQLHRMKNHKRWVDSQDKMKPPMTREEFGLPKKMEINKEQYMTVKSIFEKKVNEWTCDFEPFSEPQKVYLRGKISKILAEMQILSDEKWMLAARNMGASDNFIYMLQREKAYENLVSDYNNYLVWKKERNPERAKLEAKIGYDCYAEETEFLTDSGWKLFDEIKSTDKLATAYIGNAENRGFLEIEYENYTERFDGTFTGNLYNLVAYHTNVMITPNHNLFIQKESRKSHIKDDWSFTQAAHLPDTFNIVRQITPINKNYTDRNIFDFSKTGIDDIDFMRLMGWYLSDGTMAFSFDKTTADDLRINQIKNGKLHEAMKRFYKKYSNKIPCSIFEYDRQPNDTHKDIFTEIILSIRGILPDIIYNECGNCKEKRIPRWVFSLSQRKMNKMLDALIDGDGTRNKPDNAIIYYSSMKNLANDVQELAFMCGYETSLYGPYTYDHKMPNGDVRPLTTFQVYINKTREQFRKLGRSSIKKVPVINKRIVCFTVPNSTLITRYNGQIGIHGNSKNGSTLIRLLKVGREVLLTGKLRVKRLEDREELLSIKNCEWPYEKLIEYANKIEAEVKEAYDKSPLPYAPDIKKLDKICIELVEKSLTLSN